MIKYINALFMIIAAVFIHILMWWPWISVLLIIGFIIYNIWAPLAVVFGILILLLYIAKFIVDIL